MTAPAGRPVSAPRFADAAPFAVVAGGAGGGVGQFRVHRVPDRCARGRSADRRTFGQRRVTAADFAGVRVCRGGACHPAGTAARLEGTRLPAILERGAVERRRPRGGVSGSAPLPKFDETEGFADLNLGSPPVAWRSFSQWNADRSRKIMVLVAVRERDELAQGIAEQMIEPGLWLLPVVALALGLALRRGLKPLYALSDDVAALDPAADQRLASQNAWKEFESVRGLPSIPCLTASRRPWPVNVGWPTKWRTSCARRCRPLRCRPVRWGASWRPRPRRKRWTAFARTPCVRGMCSTSCLRWRAPAVPNWTVPRPVSDLAALARDRVCRIRPGRVAAGRRAGSQRARRALGAGPSGAAGFVAAQPD